MPELSIGKKYLKKNYPEIEVPASMGTLSTYSYLDGSIQYINNLIENLESVASQNPSMSEIVYPTIDLMKETRNRIVHNNETLLLTKKSDLEQYEKSVQDYEKIIKNPKVEEPDLQNFFEETPILIDGKITKLISKKSFGGELFPDFIAILHNGNHILIEIETPKDNIYTNKGDPSAKFAHAEQQVRDYLKWANEEKEYLRKRGLPNISAENTKGLLLIGMIVTLSEKYKEKLRQHNFSVRNSHEIKTFDEILKENQQMIKGIREARNQ